MKIKLELFGASRDFSDKDHLEFTIKDKMEIKDFRKEIINYLKKNFKGNESFKKIVKAQLFVQRIIILSMIVIKFQEIKKLELYLQ